MTNHQNNTTTESTNGYTTPIIVLGTTINSIIIFINAFLLVVVCRASHLRRNQPNIAFLISLITTHLAIGLGAFAIIPGYVVAKVSAESMQNIDHSFQFYFRFVVSYSYCVLITMLLDRLITVKKPFLYQRFTHKHAGMVTLLNFTPPSVYMIFLWWSYDTVSMSCAFLYVFTGGFLVLGNLVIFMDVKRQLIQIRGHTKMSRDDSVVATGHKLFKRKLQKSILVSLTFSLSFLVLWSPFMVVIVASIFNDTYYDSSNENLTNILWYVGLTNSIVDPIIYVVLNRPVRKALFKVLGYRSSKRSESSTSSKVTSESKN